MATAHEPSGVARAPATALADGTPFHAAPGVDVAERVGSRAEGLKSAEVEAARARWGDNRIAAKTRAPWRVFVEQFQSVLVYILLVALALSLVAPWFESEAPTLSHFTDAIVIGAILLLNAALGFVQEFRAERAVAAL